MKLFNSTNSPYSRKCRVVAIEKGVFERIELIEVFATDNPPALLAVNPLCTVPAMVSDSGMHLCESSVICEYLNTLTPEPDLYMDRICVLPFAGLAEGIIDAAVTCVQERRRPEANQYGPWLERKEAAISRAIAKFAGIPMQNSPLSIGTITLGVALGYVSFRLPHIQWRDAHPALAAWFDDFNARPSMVSTAPKP
jgi:glutathione S-transferase